MIGKVYFKWLITQNQKVSADPLNYPLLWELWIKYNYWMIKHFLYFIEEQKDGPKET